MLIGLLAFIGLFADAILGMDFSGTTVTLTFNVYLFVVLFILCALWTWISASRRRGGSGRY